MLLPISRGISLRSLPFCEKFLTEVAAHFDGFHTVPLPISRGIPTDFTPFYDAFPTEVVAHYARNSPTSGFVPDVVVLEPFAHFLVLAH